MGPALKKKLFIAVGIVIAAAAGFIATREAPSPEQQQPPVAQTPGTPQAQAPGEQPAGPQDRRPIAGQVAKARGQIEAHFDGRSRPLGLGDPVRPGDRILTGQGARLILKMVDNALIALGEDTEFLVKEYSFQSEAQQGAGFMEMVRGFFRFTSGGLAKLDQRPFRVRTPTATLGVRGTKGGANNSSIFTFEGTITAQAPNDPAPRDVPAGQHVTTNPDTGTTNPPIQTPAELATQLVMATVVPQELSSSAVNQLRMELAQQMVNQGLAANPGQALQMVTPEALQPLVERAQWDATEQVVSAALENQAQIGALETALNENLSQLLPENVPADTMQALESQIAQLEAEMDQQIQQAAQVLPEALQGVFQEAAASQEAGQARLQNELTQQLDQALTSPQAVDAALTAAQELQAQQEALNADLQAQIADAVTDPVLEQATADLAAAVISGELTQEAANQMLASTLPANEVQQVREILGAQIEQQAQIQAGVAASLAQTLSAQDASAATAILTQNLAQQAALNQQIQQQVSTSVPADQVAVVQELLNQQTQAQAALNQQVDALIQQNVAPEQVQAVQDYLSTMGQVAVLENQIAQMEAAVDQQIQQAAQVLPENIQGAFQELAAAQQTAQTQLQQDFESQLQATLNDPQAVNAVLQTAQQMEAQQGALAADTQAQLASVVPDPTLQQAALEMAAAVANGDLTQQAMNELLTQTLPTDQAAQAQQILAGQIQQQAQIQADADAALATAMPPAAAQAAADILAQKQAQQAALAQQIQEQVAAVVPPNQAAAVQNLLAQSAAAQAALDQQVSQLIQSNVSPQQAQAIQDYIAAKSQLQTALQATGGQPMDLDAVIAAPIPPAAQASVVAQVAQQAAQQVAQAVAANPGVPVAQLLGETTQQMAPAVSPVVPAGQGQPPIGPSGVGQQPTPEPTVPTPVDQPVDQTGAGEPIPDIPIPEFEDVAAPPIEPVPGDAGTGDAGVGAGTEPGTGTGAGAAGLGTTGLGAGIEPPRASGGGSSSSSSSSNNNATKTFTFTLNASAVREGAANGSVISGFTAQGLTSGTTVKYNLILKTSGGGLAQSPVDIVNNQLVVKDSTQLIVGTPITFDVRGIAPGYVPATRTFTLSVMANISTTDLPANTAEQASQGRTTYATVFNSLANAQSGDVIQVSQSEIASLILAKVAQQLTGVSLSQAAPKFDLTITPDLVTATMQIGVIDTLFNRLPTSVRGNAETLFSLVSDYASDYTANVRVQVVPVIGSDGVTISFDPSNSYVDLIHDATLVPNLRFNLQTLIDAYNNDLANLSTDGGLKFFTGGGSNLSESALIGILGSQDAAWAQMANQGTATQDFSHNAADSQAIPTSVSADYFLPGLVSGVAIQDGAVALTR